MNYYTLTVPIQWTLTHMKHCWYRCPKAHVQYRKKKAQSSLEQGGLGRTQRLCPPTSQTEGEGGLRARVLP